MTETDTTQPGDRASGNICIQCGLCCDGSMFAHAGIDKNDDMTFLKQMGVESFTIRDKLFFTLPCMGQEGKLCMIYNDARRFNVCRTFKCRLLKQYISSEISYDSAVDVIRETLIRKQSVKEFSEILRPDCKGSGQSIFSFIRELNQSGKTEDHSFRRIYAKQILDCFIFRELLKTKFYKKNSKAPDMSQ